MPPRIEDTEWEECYIEPRRVRDVERAYRKQTGFVPPGVRYFADCPWLPRVIHTFDIRRNKLTVLDLTLAEKLTLVVSQDNLCRYCFGAQRIVLGLMGVDEDGIRRMEHGQMTAGTSSGEREALQFARRLSRSDPMLTPQDVRALQDAGFSWDAIREIVLVAGYSCAINRISTLPALPPSHYERLEERWSIRLLRPFLVRNVKSKWGHGGADYFGDELTDQPYADLIRCVDGLPLGRSYKDAMDQCWQADALPRRAKLLIFAVVARALRCPLSEREANRLLLEEGLDAEDVAEILAHLSSPKLDDVEAALVPATRETVWYTPAPVQRRMRELCDRIGNPAFLEFIAVSAFANMTCRMSVLSQGY